MKTVVFLNFPVSLNLRFLLVLSLPPKKLGVDAKFTSQQTVRTRAFKNEKNVELER